MRPIFCGAVFVMTLIASSAVSDNPFAPAPPPSKAEQIKKLIARMDEIDKEIAKLQTEKDSAELEFRNLTMFTDIGVPFDVERGMMLDRNRPVRFWPQIRSELLITPESNVDPLR
jgi:hypothetical protein